MNDTGNLYKKRLKPNAQRLRKEMTKEERHLWYDFLKTVPFQFNRQKVIGNYIIDFYCDRAKIAVELDGSQHYENAGQAYDRKRDLYLEENGIKVLRYANSDVNQNFRSVCEDILKQLEMRIIKSF